MKKTLFFTIVALLILSGTALADDAAVTYVAQTDYERKSLCKDLGYDGYYVSRVGIQRPLNQPVYSSTIHTHNPEDGTVLDYTEYGIDGRNTVIKSACQGAEPGDIITTGYYDNGTNHVAWSAKWLRMGSSVSWISETFSEADVTERGQHIYRDEEGNYYAVGTTWNTETGADITLIKYNSDLERQWRTTYEDDGTDSPYGIVGMDSEYVTVLFEKRSGNEFRPVGLRLRRGDGGIQDPSRVFYGIKLPDVDDVWPAGTVFERSTFYQSADDTCFYIAATLVTSSGTDIWTACCDYEGNYLWEKVFDGGGDDWANDICTGFGYVYVVGSSHNGTDYDTRMIRYDEAGNETWNMTYDNGVDEELYTICLEPTGSFYVGGYTQEDTVSSALLIKYSQPDVVGISEQPLPSSQPPSVTLKVTDNLSPFPTINYSLPQGEHGTLTFYSADGRMLESYSLDPSQTTFQWLTDNPPGVYFVQLRSAVQVMQAKIVISK